MIQPMQACIAGVWQPQEEDGTGADQNVSDAYIVADHAVDVLHAAGAHGGRERPRRRPANGVQRRPGPLAACPVSTGIDIIPPPWPCSWSNHSLFHITCDCHDALHDVLLRAVDDVVRPAPPQNHPVCPRHLWQQDRYICLPSRWGVQRTPAP